MSKSIEEQIYDEIKHSVQGVSLKDWIVEFGDKERKIVIEKSGIVLQIYARDNLIGYELYPSTAPRYMMQSDTDLYDLDEDEDLVVGIRKEILYVLAEYVSGNIRIQKISRKTWYGKVREGYQIKMKLPSGESLVSSLPCINQIDFGY